jgi:hypothetical protein
MRYVLLALVALLPRVGDADPSQFDSKLALDAARAYVESYLRWHPRTPAPRLEWDKATSYFVPWKHESYSGYVGVFVPNAVGPECGAAVFEVGADLPGHLFLVRWGYAESLSDATRRFQKNASRGNPEFLLE